MSPPLASVQNKYPAGSHAKQVEQQAWT